MPELRNEIPDDTAGNPFVTLRQLLQHPRKASVGTIATAIEKNGIYAYDRFGRYKVCVKATAEAEQALGLLAWVFEFESENWDATGENRQVAEGGGDLGDPEDYGEPHPLDIPCENDDPFNNYGWAKAVLPNFASIRSGQIEISRRTLASAKLKETSNIHIIAALLDYIEGNMPNVEKHPSFSSEEKLIADLVDQYDGFKGVKPRTIQKRFKAAKSSVGTS